MAERAGGGATEEDREVAEGEVSRSEIDATSGTRFTDVLPFCRTPDVPFVTTSLICER